MQHSVFITGTDTGIGKTLYSRLLLQSLNAAGLRTAAMKPVASGAQMVEGEWRNEDAILLQQTANISCSYHCCNPYCFAPAIAPHLAAEQAGVEIEIPVIRQAYTQLSNPAEVTVVEGVGGWLVPLNRQHSVADLVATLQLPVILVVGLRLGCLNHALLTAASIAQRGVRLIGWVANVIEPDMPKQQENIETLRQRIEAPLLDVIDFINQSTQISRRQDLNIKWLEY